MFKFKSFDNLNKNNILGKKTSKFITADKMPGLFLVNGLETQNKKNSRISCNFQFFQFINLIYN